MLKLFPAYFLLLGLACQLGHAQRSGSTFSILSESIGPLVAEGNTSTTGFSQIGAIEAIQGTFSSATTGFSGTIGFLGAQSANSSQPNHTVDLNSTVNLEMIWVEPGTFTMGSPTSETGRGPGETEHNVTLTKGFYLGKYEVTQAQYEAVMTGNVNSLSATPSQFGGNPTRPVELVSWDDAQVFLARLNAAEQTAGRLPAGWQYVLPTESEWEYACRAGTATVYSWGNTIATSNANYSSSGFSQTRDVGQYAANPWGFYDMHGNVYEWLADWYGTYPAGPVTDPLGVASGSDRVHRGSSWSNDAMHLRAAKRDYGPPSFRYHNLGFRLAYKQITTPPTDLNTTAPLTIAENQPVGTVVGEFNATDPDAGATLTYHLVSGAGDTHNTLFTLETNGTLKTATTFDYESNASSYAIRIKVKDELNASMEGNYTVTLTDANDPVIGSVSISGTPQVEQTLTASNTLADPDGLGAITYQWYRDGVPINMLKDGVGGVDGLNATRGIILSADGKHAYVTGSSDSAVSWYERNASTGALTYGGMLKDDAGGVDGLNGAWDVTLSADGNHAYVTGFSDDAVSWYERNASTGALTYGGMLKDGVNGVDGLGGAWGVTLSADGNHAYVTGYFDFAVSWHERNASTGALTYGGLLKDGVGGVDGLGSASSVTLSADGNHAYVTGSTDDAVSWHERNASTGALTYGGMVKDGVNGVDGLGGAYNVTLSADGKHAYVTGSVDDAVSWYERNASTGALTYGGVLKDGVGGVDGLDNAFGVTLSADGKHAYVTGANDDAVSWYERNASTGALTYGGMLKDGVGGVDGLDSAFGVTLSADGNHAYVAGNYDDAVSWFTRDPGTGALSYVQTGATYVLTPADAGSVITAKASYTDGGSFEHNVTSAGTASVQPANSAPTDLNSTAPLTIAENQPIGTVVGVFIATDPDAGATLTYQFVSGVGDGNNSLFTLETNGTLKTATTFDYESNASTYAIRVKVKDEHNASMEGNFTVTLTNMYEPSQSNHVVDLNSTVNLEMIWVEPGSFTMGRDLPHAAYVAHLVTLTNGFYLGKHEVTKAQYETVMAGNPDGLSATPGNYSNPNGPAAGISWEHVQVFLSRLNNANSANIPVGWKYVLPTEAEWEYSCRAGSTTSYFWGNESNPGKANFAESGYGKAITVGSYQPNYWGFYDMHGNVREWTSDWKIGYTSSDQIDPVGAVSGTHRINRGGAWNSPASLLTSFIRINNFPNFASGAVGFRLAFKQITTPPANLNSTAPLTIAENQSVGTVVGEFNATDPDVNATLTYQLVSGAGDGNNSLFTLDANGTLKTATTFDYETNVSTFSIRVQTKDEHNASVEGNFTVILTDVYEPPPDPGGNENNSTTESNQTGQSNPVGEYFRPLVETGQAEGVSRTSATLKGTVPDDGGSAISERGFLLSNKPNPRVDSSGVIRLVVDAGTSVFSASATNLQASKKYYFRAYATNAEGTGYGLEESFRTTFVPRGPSWIDAVPGTANNWWSSPWLGSFYLNANGWARHEKLGWVFPMESPTAGLWLWKEGLGWLWTNKEIYPFLYQNGNGGWLYFFGRRQETLLFYDYFTKRWITRNEGQ